MRLASASFQPSFALRFVLRLVSAVTAAAVVFPFIMGSFSLAAAQDAAGAQPISAQHLIRQPIDESQLTTLKGNTHPLARPEFDLGTASADLPMQRMLLVLKRSPVQEAALAKLLDNQQDKSSPNYHKWVTPEQFGKKFGPTDADMRTIVAWLQSHGFEVGSTKGRTVLEFSGTAGQVQEAFHTSIHSYLVNGEQHWANSSDPQIPTALAGAVAGVMTLHNFISKPASHLAKTPVLAQIVQNGSKRQVTFPPQNGQAAINALGPQDYSVIYNINPVYNNGMNGNGVFLGVIGRNNLYNGGNDVENFFSVFNNSCPGNFQVVVNGPDPGDAGGSEEAEATLDSSWSKGIAQCASTSLIVSGSTNSTDGIDLSELFIIESDSYDIMTESFSTCEYYATDARLAGINAMAEQAAAQGITYFVSTGDSGAEGCDDPSNPPASGPVSVNALASTPFNVAVGGTMFNDNGDPSKYWTSNPPISETAVSYIPENVWNESSLTNGLWSGSGGASAGNIGNALLSPLGTTAGVPKPSWQFGQGLNIPADGVRDLPDVALTAAGHDPYLLCLEGSCIPNSQNEIFVYFISGTSASAPAFAGIMALVDQSQGGRQGQANYQLYSLAAMQAGQSLYPSQCNGSSTSNFPASNCIFNDVTVGNNVVPGEIGSSYQAQPGFDLATGLGSVNVANLVSNWNAVTFNPTTTTLALNGGTADITINHGQSISVAAAVTPNSGTGTPAGDVVLLTSNGLAPSTLNQFRLNSGLANGSTSDLPGSGSAPNTVWVHYGGDGSYAPSDSNRINVTVNSEPSTTTLSLQANDLRGNLLTSPFPFGSLVFVRADVSGNSGHGIPTGSVDFSDTFGSLPSLNPQVNPPVQVINDPRLNSQGNTSIGDGIISFDAGNHSIAASYSGDPSFSASGSTTPVTFTIQPGFVGVAGPTDVSISAPGGAGTTTVGIVASTGFNTAISFTCSGLPAEATCASASATGQGPTTVVFTNITISTTAAHTAVLKSNRAVYVYAAFLGGGLPLGLFFFVAAPRRRRWNGVAVGILLILLILVPACGGGGGSSQSHQDPGTPTGTYSVTVTATAGSISEQSHAFTLVVQ